MVKKTAKQHLATQKEIKKVVMDKAWGGMAVGDTMLVATPQIVDSFIRGIAYGDTRTIPDFRSDLALQYDCEGTCPLSTSIFVRICAQAALEDLTEGKSTDQITPFWRVITSKDKIAKKLDVDGEWIDKQRKIEAE